MSFSATTATAVNLSMTAETIVLTSPTLAVAPPGNTEGYVVRGAVNVTTGTASTVTLRVRQGTALSGNVVGNPMTVSTANVTTYQWGVSVVDTNIEPSSSYILTVQQNSGTSTGTANFALIETDLAIP